GVHVHVAGGTRAHAAANRRDSIVELSKCLHDFQSGLRIHLMLDPVAIDDTQKRHELTSNCGWGLGYEGPEPSSVPVRGVRRQSASPAVRALAGTRAPLFKGVRQAHSELILSLQFSGCRRPA